METGVAESFIRFHCDLYWLLQFSFLWLCQDSHSHNENWLFQRCQPAHPRRVWPPRAGAHWSFVAIFTPTFCKSEWLEFFFFSSSSRILQEQVWGSFEGAVSPSRHCFPGNEGNLWFERGKWQRFPLAVYLSEVLPMRAGSFFLRQRIPRLLGSCLQCQLCGHGDGDSRFSWLSRDNIAESCFPLSSASPGLCLPLLTA